MRASRLCGWRGLVLSQLVSKKTRIMRILPAVLVLLVMAVTHVQASFMTWEAPVTISSDSDIATLGTLDRAYNMGGAATTVNGVLFGRFAQNGQDGFDSDTYRTWTVGNTTLGDGSKRLYDPTSRGFASAPFSGLSSGYQTLLSSANYNASDDWSSIGPLRLTLNGLTIGQKYLFQSWVNDSRKEDAGRSQNANSGGATSATMQFNTSGATDGGVGQYLIGTFTADATSQVVTFSGLAEPYYVAEISGFQLRSVPEPSSLVLFVSCIFGLLAYAWRKRK